GGGGGGDLSKSSAEEGRGEEGRGKEDELELGIWNYYWDQCGGRCLLVLLQGETRDASKLVMVFVLIPL
uniref:Uncharacterized protein n=1 Tax=Oryza brachyantha TaxID=4533 RepID=J3N3Y6_ORYBR